MGGIFVRKLISAVSWIIVIAFLFFSAVYSNIVPVGFALFLLMFWGFYWLGNLAATMDREAEITNTTLPLWKRRILFFGQPNPFREKTNIFQTFVVTTGLLVFAIFIIVPETAIGGISMIAWLVAALILSVICDIRLRRKHKDTKDAIAEWRSMSKKKRIVWLVVFVVLLVIAAIRLLSI